MIRQTDYNHNITKGTITDQTLAAWNRRVQPVSGNPITDNKPITNADRIRCVSDEELAKIIVSESVSEKIPFCQNKPECSKMLDDDELIPESHCIKCALDWLQKPAETEGEGMSDLFTGIMRTEYVVDDSGFKVPHSDFDRPPEYYAKMREKTYTGDEYADMCRFKDKSLALFDHRWKSAKAVIDIVARAIGEDPETTGLFLYGALQINGEFTSPLVEKMEHWFDKSGDKVKMKRRIAELEAQLTALQAAIRGGTP